MAKFRLASSLTRWMCFVDGENFTIRGQSYAHDANIQLNKGPFYDRDVFLWLPGQSPIDVILRGRAYGSYSVPLRSYYYTSLVGDDQKIDQTRDALWELGFHPEVFKKDKKEQKAKGVDIALAKDFLGNAFRHNYDVAFLFAGDADYVPLVEEAKRLGKIVCVVFFQNNGMSPKLKLAADFMLPVDSVFDASWSK